MSRKRKGKRMMINGRRKGRKGERREKLYIFLLV